MSRYVFLGPTLAGDEAKRLSDAVVLPPVRQGDVERLLRSHDVERIGIVDGYFSRMPAVWHKEILSALDRGIVVVGAASMGALRAAELMAFGMQGVGVVYAAYRDGVYPGYDDERFEDDDEVAVVHGPAEAGYARLSEALVNIRSTLNAAHRDGVIDADTRSRLAALAKRRYYPRRSHGALFEDARADGVNAAVIDALERWWPGGIVDQKADDARLLLASFDSTRATPDVHFELQYTASYDALVRSVDLDVGLPSDVRLEELQIAPHALATALAAVAAELLAVEAEGQSHAELVSRAARDHLRAACGAYEESAAESVHAARLRAWLDRMPRAALAAHLSRWLGDTDLGRDLCARADAKQRALADADALPDAHELNGLEQLQLENWYFEHCLARSMPDDVDAHVRAAMFRDRAAFHRALMREYRYRCGYRVGYRRG